MPRSSPLTPHVFGDEVRRELRKLAADRNNYRALLALGIDLAVIAITMVACSTYHVLYPLGVVVIGTRQRALANILHDSTHRSLSRSRALNQWLGVIAGWTVLQTTRDYRMSHVLTHHKFFGLEDKDPDLQNYRQQGLYETKSNLIFPIHLSQSLLGPRGLRRLWNIVKEKFLFVGWHTRPQSVRREHLVFFFAWVSVAIVLIWAGLAIEFVLFWLVPFVTVYQAVDWLTEVAEHFPLTELHRSELRVTRNRRGHLLERLLTGTHSEDWHLVHHLQPGIPFWNLRKAHEVLSSDPAYRAANSLHGGLFTRGPLGEPTIASSIGPELRRVQGLDAA